MRRHHNLFIAVALVWLLPLGTAHPRLASRLLDSNCQCDCCYTVGAHSRTECIPPTATSFSVFSCSQCDVHTCATHFPTACAQVSSMVTASCVKREGWMLRLVPVAFILIVVALVIYGLCVRKFDGYHDDQLLNHPRPRFSQRASYQTFGATHGVQPPPDGPTLPLLSTIAEERDQSHADASSSHRSPAPSAQASKASTVQNLQPEPQRQINTQIDNLLENAQATQYRQAPNIVSILHSVPDAHALEPNETDTITIAENGTTTEGIRSVPVSLKSVQVHSTLVQSAVRDDPQTISNGEQHHVSSQSVKAVENDAATLSPQLATEADASGNVANTELFAPAVPCEMREYGKHTVHLPVDSQATSSTLSGKNPTGVARADGDGTDLKQGKLIEMGRSHEDVAVEQSVTPTETQTEIESELQPSNRPSAPHPSSRITSGSASNAFDPESDAFLTQNQETQQQARQRATNALQAHDTSETLLITDGAESPSASETAPLASGAEQSDNSLQITSAIHYGQVPPSAPVVESTPDAHALVGNEGNATTITDNRTSVEGTDSVTAPLKCVQAGSVLVQSAVEDEPHTENHSEQPCVSSQIKSAVEDGGLTPDVTAMKPDHMTDFSLLRENRTASRAPTGEDVGAELGTKADVDANVVEVGQCVSALPPEAEEDGLQATNLDSAMDAGGAVAGGKIFCPDVRIEGSKLVEPTLSGVGSEAERGAIEGCTSELEKQTDAEDAMETQTHTATTQRDESTDAEQAGASALIRGMRRDDVDVAGVVDSNDVEGTEVMAAALEADDGDYRAESELAESTAIASLMDQVDVPGTEDGAAAATGTEVEKGSGCGKNEKVVSEEQTTTDQAHGNGNELQQDGEGLQEAFVDSSTHESVVEGQSGIKEAIELKARAETTADVACGEEREKEANTEVKQEASDESGAGEGFVEEQSGINTVHELKARSENAVDGAGGEEMDEGVDTEVKQEADDGSGADESFNGGQSGLSTAHELKVRTESAIDVAGGEEMDEGVDTEVKQEADDGSGADESFNGGQSGLSTAHELKVRTESAVDGADGEEKDEDADTETKQEASDESGADEGFVEGQSGLSTAHELKARSESAIDVAGGEERDGDGDTDVKQKANDESGAGEGFVEGQSGTSIAHELSARTESAVDGAGGEERDEDGDSKATHEAARGDEYEGNAHDVKRAAAGRVHSELEQLRRDMMEAHAQLEATRRYLHETTRGHAHDVQ